MDWQHIRSSWHGSCGAQFVKRHTGIDFVGDGWYTVGNRFILAVKADEILVRFWVWVDFDPRGIFFTASQLPERNSVNTAAYSADAGANQENRQDVASGATQTV